MSEVLLKLDAAHASTVSDQVMAEVRSGRPRLGRKLLEPVHEEHEPAVPSFGTSIW